MTCSRADGFFFLPLFTLLSFDLHGSRRQREFSNSVSGKNVKKSWHKMPLVFASGIFREIKKKILYRFLTDIRSFQVNYRLFIKFS